MVLAYRLYLLSQQNASKDVVGVANVGARTDDKDVAISVVERLKMEKKLPEGIVFIAVNPIDRQHHLSVDRGQLTPWSMDIVSRLGQRTYVFTLKDGVIVE